MVVAMTAVKNLAHGIAAETLAHDETILYALPRADELGRSDVWAVGVAEGSEPRRLLDNASSPSVVQAGGGS